MREGQPKHRQMRKEQRRLERKRASLRGLPSILIVCEGRETEPNYIDGLRDYLHVNAAAVHIVSGGSVTDPVGLVRKAQRHFHSDGGFDLVYVVCDGDSGRLAEARGLAQRTLRNAARERTHVRIIANCPSIEYWLLLHFEYSARPFQNAAEVTTQLRAHLTDYRKNDKDIFRKVASGLGLACQRAQQLEAELSASGARAPYTDMRLLVEQFRQMQSP